MTRSLALLLVCSLLLGAGFAPCAAAEPYWSQTGCHGSQMVLPPVVHELAGPHPVEHYLDWALRYSPDVQAARREMEAKAHRVAQEASLDDPRVQAMGYPFFPNVPQTASGRMTVDVTVSQEVPWIGKLRGRASAAEAEVNMARAQLAATELAVVEQVKRAYYELYYLQQAVAITERDQRLVADYTDIAQRKYEAATAPQQDYLRAQLEGHVLQTELLRLRQELTAARARLARWLHVSPDTPLAALPQLPAASVPGELEVLYHRAVMARPELHERLAALARDRENIQLAHLENVPDVELMAGWGEMTTNRALAPTADGLDNVSIGMSLNVPLYRQRIAAGIREAEAQASATARQYDAVRDETFEQITALFAEIHSQQQLLLLYREQILPTADQTLAVSNQAYEAGTIDFLDVLDIWRQLLRYQTAYYRLESQQRQALATLERLVGGSLEGLAMETVPAPPPMPQEQMR